MSKPAREGVPARHGADCDARRRPRVLPGPTTGLERVDLSILPLVPLADALMCTRAYYVRAVPPSSRTPVVLRASGDRAFSKALRRADRVDIEDAARLNVAALAVQVFIGGEHETQSVHT